jgi:hypothetical protein
MTNLGTIMQTKKLNKHRTFIDFGQQALDVLRKNSQGIGFRRCSTKIIFIHIRTDHISLHTQGVQKIIVAIHGSLT